MPLRTRCPRCETVLNVPVGAEARKLKCPRCLETFRVGAPGASARSSQPGMDTAQTASSPSSSELPRPGTNDEPDLPRFSGDLRDRFDLPLLQEESDDQPKSAPQVPGPASTPESASDGLPIPPTTPSPYAEADAAGLVEEDETDDLLRRRRRGGAEARMTSRRCSCGGVVPAGMSICPSCGLDQETGTRDTTFDVLEVELPAPRVSTTPMGVMIVGVTSAIVGVSLTLTSLILYILQADQPLRWGFLLLAVLGALGTYGAVRMMQGRSARFLLFALLLGGLIDIGALIVLPISRASAVPMMSSPRAQQAGQGNSQSVDVPARPRIVPLTERINWNQVNVGLAILGATAIVAIYLNTAQVRRYGRGG